MPAVPGAWMAADAATGTVMTLSWTCTWTKACGSSRVRNHPARPRAAHDGRGHHRAGLETFRTIAGGDPEPEHRLVYVSRGTPVALAPNSEARVRMVR